MIRVALTGSIGMGKSATAAMFAQRGVPVFDADAAVHKAYAPGGEAVAQVEWAFPGVMATDGSIDRDLLRKKVAQTPGAIDKLNALVHPIVNGMRKDFMDRATASNTDIVLFDIPLLYETGGEKRVDAVVVVTAPPEVQRARVLARGRMTEEEFEAILARQTPDSVKRQRADFVINTGYGFAYAEAQVDAILAALRSGQGGKPGTDTPEDSCAKSSSTPKPPASTRAPATASSRSD
jgi:dephospho-CoA kinase